MNYNHPELRQRLADEYVMGTLHGAARRRFERLLQDDAGLHNIVQQTSAKWNLLVETLPPLQPSSDLWQDIERRITPQPAPQPTVSAVSSSQRQQQQVEKESWDWLVSFWRGWAMVASAAVVLLALYMGIFLPVEKVTYVVVVTDDAESRASWVLGTDDDLQQLVVRALQPQPLADDRAFQLWMKVADEERVRPVGLIPAAGESILALSPTLANVLNKAEKFGVSVESPGGSPTGQPTTTPLYHGSVLRL